MNKWIKKFTESLNFPNNVSDSGPVTSPFKDYDKDGLQNLNDCDPKNKKKQDTILSKPKVVWANSIKEKMASERVVPKNIIPQKYDYYHPSSNIKKQQPKPIIWANSIKEKMDSRRVLTPVIPQKYDYYHPSSNIKKQQPKPIVLTKR